MTEIKSWLSSNYSKYDYDSGIDNDATAARRRKAIAELRSLIREKNIEQINRIIKEY